MMNRLFCLASALAATLSGCMRPLYGGPVDLPADCGLLPIDAYLTTYVVVSDGGRKPLGVLDLRAECDNPDVCSASVRAENSWPIVDVFGVRPGTANLVLRYVHPGRHVAEEHRVRLRVVAAPTRPLLTVGSSEPRERVVNLATEQGLPAGRCEEGNLELAMALGGEPREGTRLFTCHRGRDVKAGDWRARTCAQGLCPDSTDESWLAVCASTRDGVVVAVSTFERVRGPGTRRSFRRIERCGEAEDEACTLRP